jgi:hypothetical protein
LNLVAHLRHGNVARVRQAIRACARVSSQEDHGEAGFLDEARRETVIRAGVGKDLGRVALGFEHHCTQARCLEGWDAAANVGEGKGLIAELVWFTGLEDTVLVESELDKKRYPLIRVYSSNSRLFTYRILNGVNV